MSDGLAHRAETTARLGAIRHDFLAFDLASDRFGLPLRDIREILKVGPITEVPRSRPEILGILSVRGRITTVIDLRVALGRPPVAVRKGSRILLVQGEGEIVGFLVDRVEGVSRLYEDEIEEAGVVAGDLADYVTGVGRPGRFDAEAEDGVDDLMILLDGAAILRRSSRRTR
jgi:purine-binding chemotaxis protein CheW